MLNHKSSIINRKSPLRRRTHIKMKKDRSKTIDIHPFPKLKELWMLWDINVKDFVIALDDPRKYNAYLCAMSKPAILALRQHQKEGYEVDSVPVKVI